jgi:HPt (histidine-containing phosphotransfer) domain-containing protein
MDVQMPEMDGFEATALIRRQETATGKHVPILAMTAYALKGDRERCLAAGMDGYLSKPIRVGEFLDEIEKAVAPLPIDPQPQDSEPDNPADDWTEALAGVGGDRSLLRDLAGVFLAEYPKWLAQIRTALTEGNSREVHLAAHTLKGTLSTFGAKAAQAAAFRLEIMGRENNLSSAEEAWDVLEQEMKRLHPALAALAREASP